MINLCEKDDVEILEQVFHVSRSCGEGSLKTQPLPVHGSATLHSCINPVRTILALHLLSIDVVLCQLLDDRFQSKLRGLKCIIN